MLRILTPFVILHWAALFSLLVFLCLLAGDDGVAQAFRFLGLTVGERMPVRIFGQSDTSILALAMAVCAVLFWWALLESLLGADAGAQPGTPVLDMAFSGAIATLTLVVFLGAMHDVAGLLPVVAIHLCALLASYCAVAYLGRRHSATAADKAASLDARGRAGQASQAASLIRLSARNSLLGSD